VARDGADARDRLGVATQLFLILLDEYHRWTADDGLVRKLEPNARAALAWIEGPADMDGDGYLEYQKRSNSDRALNNHCWKDSDDSILFADGRRAEPPIATCELQGYAYDARCRLSRASHARSGTTTTSPTGSSETRPS
jgi:glycogen debranching enzyme